MRTYIVLTLTGKDRVGIVEEITELLLKLGGNVETSQMARLGGEFAILMLVSLPADQLAKLEQDALLLTRQGYKLTISQTEPDSALSRAGWQGYQIKVEGADHEGIIHEIARSLAKCGISVETMETGTHPAPLSGTPLFTMTAQVVIPADVAGRNWQADVIETGHRLNVDVTVSAVNN
jgi:glycine cleavage system transcriptional repressor